MSSDATQNSWLTDEQRVRLADYKSAFSFTDSDRRIASESYSDGSSSSSNRSMRRGQRAIKHEKHWRTSQQERRVLYTTKSADF